MGRSRRPLLHGRTDSSMENLPEPFAGISGREKVHLAELESNSLTMLVIWRAHKQINMNLFCVNNFLSENIRVCLRKRVSCGSVDEIPNQVCKVNGRLSLRSDGVAYRTLVAGIRVLLGISRRAASWEGETGTKVSYKFGGALLRLPS